MCLKKRRSHPASRVRKVSKRAICEHYITRPQGISIRVLTVHMLVCYAVSIMVEREPSFEDDKIRTWTFGPDGGAPEEFEDDPTLMHVDVEREEIYESRTYRFRDDPAVFAFLVEMAAAQLHQAGPRSPSPLQTPPVSP